MQTLPISPLLSIVIPTKDRYETLLPTLNALLDNILGTSYEIIVQDNSENPDEALTFLKYRSDARIRYVHRSGHLSIVENTEAALSRAQGEYITFIGDDDLVAPNILGFVEYFLDRNVDAVIYPPAYYWWPSVRFAKQSSYYQPGAFWYPRATSTSEHQINSKLELNRVISAGAVALFNLPRVYHGLVRRRILDAIKTRTGQYVNGASPDMALAIATAFEVSRHIKVDTPLTIYGASQKSGGGWTAANTHFGKIEDQPHLPQDTKDHWSDRLPPIWSEHTIYPQSVIEVFRSMGRQDTLNYAAFYASMLVNEPYLSRLTLPFAIRYLSQNPQSVLHFATLLVKKSIGRFRRSLRSRVIGLPFQINICTSPDACMKYLRDSS
jgi:glycosyltransferase involved in cell wall biosynthesis